MCVLVAIIEPREAKVSTKKDHAFAATSRGAVLERGRWSLPWLRFVQVSYARSGRGRIRTAPQMAIDASERTAGAQTVRVRPGGPIQLIVTPLILVPGGSLLIFSCSWPAREKCTAISVASILLRTYSPPSTGGILKLNI